MNLTLTLTRHSSIMIDNNKQQFQLHRSLIWLNYAFAYPTLTSNSIVARVPSKTSKGITDLISPSHFLNINKKSTSIFNNINLLNKLIIRISYVYEINHTSYPTNTHRPCTTKNTITQKFFVFLSLIKFPMLSQIKPKNPRLMVPFRQLL